VILTGAGRAFSAGGDLGMIQERADHGASEPGRARRSIREAMRSFYQLFLSVREIPCPTLAALNGHAIGAGLCVALACDVRIAAEDAKLGLNFTRLGLHPGMGATWTLPRLVGSARAAELLFSSRILTGAEAAAIGLVSRAVPREQVLPAARELAAAFATCAPLAVRGVKRALARSLEATWRTSSPSRPGSRPPASRAATCRRVWPRPASAASRSSRAARRLDPERSALGIGRMRLLRRIASPLRNAAGLPACATSLATQGGFATTQVLGVSFDSSSR